MQFQGTKDVGYRRTVLDGVSPHNPTCCLGLAKHHGRPTDGRPGISCLRSRNPQPRATRDARPRFLLHPACTKHSRVHFATAAGQQPGEGGRGGTNPPPATQNASQSAARLPNPPLACARGGGSPRSYASNSPGPPASKRTSPGPEATRLLRISGNTSPAGRLLANPPSPVHRFRAQTPTPAGRPVAATQRPKAGGQVTRPTMTSPDLRSDTASSTSVLRGLSDAYWK